MIYRRNRSPFILYLILTLMLSSSSSCQWLSWPVLWSWSWSCMVTVSAFPSTITIGNLIQLTNNGLEFTWGIEQASTMVRTLELINGDPSLLPNTTIVQYIRDAADPAASMRWALNLLDSGVVALVGATTSSRSVATAQVAGVMAKPQISWPATSPSLTDKLLYPTFLRTCPSDAFQGRALAEVAAFYKWTNVAVYAVATDYGEKIGATFTQWAQKYGINILYHATHSEFLTDPYDAITALQAIKALDLRVIILLSLDEAAVAVIKAAKMLDMTTSQYSFLVSEGVYGFPQDLEAGILGTVPTAGSGPLLASFLADFKNRTQSSNTSAPNYAIDTTKPVDMSSYGVDALYTIAHALHAMYIANEDPTDGTLLLKRMLAVDFQGITGSIFFDENGERVGVSYDLMNLVNSSTSYRADGTPYFQQVKIGEWVPPSNISLPGTVVITSSAIWFEGSLTPANTTRGNDGGQSITYMEFEASSLLFNITIALTLVTLIIISIIWLIMYKWRNTLMMKASSPPFNLTMLCGAGLFAICALLYIIPPSSNDVICDMRIWCTTLSFILTYAPLFVKTFRLARIFNGQRLRIVAIRNRDLAMGISVLIAIQIMINIVWQLADAPRYESNAISTLSNDAYIVYRVPQCSTSPIFIGITFTYLGALVLFGLVTAIRVRSAPVGFNESFHICICIGFISVYVALILPLQLLLSDRPDALSLLRSIGIILGIWITLTCIFGPKLLIIHEGTADVKEGTSGATEMVAGQANNNNGNNNNNTKLFQPSPHLPPPSPSPVNGVMINSPNGTSIPRSGMTFPKESPRATYGGCGGTNGNGNTFLVPSSPALSYAQLQMRVNELEKWLVINGLSLPPSLTPPPSTPIPAATATATATGNNGTRASNPTTTTTTTGGTVTNGSTFVFASLSQLTNTSAAHSHVDSNNHGTINNQSPAHAHGHGQPVRRASDRLTIVHVHPGGNVNINNGGPTAHTNSNSNGGYGHMNALAQLHGHMSSSGGSTNQSAATTLLPGQPHTHAESIVDRVVTTSNVLPLMTHHSHGHGNGNNDNGSNNNTHHMGTLPTGKSSLLLRDDGSMTGITATATHSSMVTPTPAITTTASMLYCQDMTQLGTMIMGENSTTRTSTPVPAPVPVAVTPTTTII